MNNKKHILQVLVKQLADAIDQEQYAEAALILADLQQRIGVEPGEATD
jgi:protein-arginine kinase activator protein McsA